MTLAVITNYKTPRMIMYELNEAVKIGMSYLTEYTQIFCYYVKNGIISNY